MATIPNKITLLTLILPLLLAPFGHILAQDAASSTETVNYTDSAPNTPADGFIKEWITDGKLRSEVRAWMATTQRRLEQSAEQAMGSAQQAAKDEISRQADQATQGAMEKAKAYVDRAITIVKGNTYLLISKIISFLNNLLR